MEVAIFEELEANDILFVDSSHVVKLGSDVHHLLAQVRPRLRPGVVIHFHDVFWPFQYPEEWVLSGRAWNEAYVLHAFLQYNAAFEIEYFSDYVATRYRDRLAQKLPLCLRNPGGGLWIRKVV